MARQTLVLDASVGVKWFSARGEVSLSQALAIRNAHVSGEALIAVPELFFYEVANAIIHKDFIPLDAAQSAIASMFDLGLNAVSTSSDLLETSLILSRSLRITVYDSCYIALAQKYNCPLVTANPRHQKEIEGCKVIPIEKWGQQ